MLLLLLLLTEALRLNEVPFLGVLIASANRQLVQECLDHFESMKSVNNLEPQMKHYGCMVNLIGRADQLALRCLLLLALWFGNSAESVQDTMMM